MSRRLVFPFLLVAVVLAIGATAAPAAAEARPGWVLVGYDYDGTSSPRVVDKVNVVDKGALDAGLGTAGGEARVLDDGPATVRAVECIYDHRSDFARPPPGGAVSCVYDATSNLADPADGSGRVPRASAGSEVLTYTPRGGPGGGRVDLYHATTTPGAAQGVVNGVNPARLNSGSRFGRAFYTSESPNTALAELAHYGATPTHGVRFSMNTANARVLDLADTRVASAWGYSGGPISRGTQAIGSKAVAAGYNVIRFPSLRGRGMNWAILDDFDDLLTPQMITPAG